ncbi:MAG: nuclear transport factor 2 family protein [Leptolyngbyaceae cyanobacterium CAN_BIN12]|nr:nuclear transport factor 2 family protein [Leptolyngbyaceae cyanobacterium CAN_BIN12]
MHPRFRDRSASTVILSASQLESFPRATKQWQGWMFGAGLAASLLSPMLPLTAQAQNPASSAPAQLTTLLTQMDAAANARNLNTVLDLHGSNFSSTDGLNRQNLQQSLGSLWKRYPKLSYQTELKSWKNEGNGIVADTVTRITGTFQEGDREYNLDSTLESRQRIENQKVVRQEITNERSQITSGSNPPTLKINLPNQVTRGQEFSFDAIVQEPLGDDLLLGAALEETIKPEGYLNATTINLEPLNSGGIFKVGKAPTNSEQHWLSAVVVRHDGITMVTQRLRIVGN